MNLLVLLALLCFPLVEFFLMFGYLTKGPLPMYITVVSLLLGGFAVLVGGFATLAVTIPVAVLLFVYVSHSDTRPERTPGMHAHLAKQKMTDVIKFSMLRMQKVISSLGSGVLATLAAGGIILILFFGASLIVYVISVYGWDTERLTNESDTNPFWAFMDKMGWSFPAVHTDSDIIMSCLASIWRWFRGTFANFVFDILNFVRIVVSVITPAWNFGLDYVQESTPRFYDTFTNCSADVLTDTRDIMRLTGAAFGDYVKPFAAGDLGKIYPENFTDASKHAAETVTLIASTVKKDILCYCDNGLVIDIADIIFFEPRMEDTIEHLFQNVTSTWVSGIGAVIRTFPPYNKNPFEALLGPDGTMQFWLGALRSVACIVDRWIFLVLRQALNFIANVIETILADLKIPDALPLHVYADEVPVTGFFTAFMGLWSFLVEAVVHVPYSMAMFIYDIAEKKEFDVTKYNMQDAMSRVDGVASHYATAMYWVLDKIRMFFTGEGNERPMDIGVFDATCEQLPANVMFMVSCFVFEWISVLTSAVSALLGYIVGFLAVVGNVIYTVQTNSWLLRGRR